MTTLTTRWLLLLWVLIPKVECKALDRRFGIPTPNLYNLRDPFNWHMNLDNSTLLSIVFSRWTRDTAVGLT